MSSTTRSGRLVGQPVDRRRAVAGLVHDEAVALQVAWRRPRGPSARRRRRARVGAAPVRASIVAVTVATVRPRRRVADRGAARVSRPLRGTCARRGGRGRTVEAWLSRPSCRTAPSGPPDHPSAPSCASGRRRPRRRRGGGCRARRRRARLRDRRVAAVVDHGRRHAVHRPLRGVAQGPRDRPVRHERQGRADHRHRRRVARCSAPCSAGRRCAGRWSASSASSRSAPSACSRTSTTRSASRRSASSPRSSPRRPGSAPCSACCTCCRLGRRRRRRRTARCQSPGESRRLFLISAGSLAVLAAGAAVLGRRLGRSDVVESARGSDRPAAPAASTPGAGRAPATIPDVARADAVHHAERRLLPHRHRPRRAPGRRRRLEAAHRGRRRQPVRADVRRARRDGRLRGHRHDAVRVERGRRQPRRQRHVAGRAARDAARPGRRAARRARRSSATRSTASRPASRPRSASTAARRSSPSA